VAAISALLLFAASAVQAKTKKPVAPNNLTLVWPLPPEPPRIKLIRSIYGAADVEPIKKANFPDRVAGIQIKNFKPGFAKPFGVNGIWSEAPSGQPFPREADRATNDAALGRLWPPK
jgi:hypothetical protein